MVTTIGEPAYDTAEPSSATSVGIGVRGGAVWSAQIGIDAHPSRTDVLQFEVDSQIFLADVMNTAISSVSLPVIMPSINVGTVGR